MIANWEMLDLYKGLFALAAGIVLGLERELKDKAAGLKTITVITLGSALFALLSYKLGKPDGEATRIASYVVSGIGFLGAGVIFKNGLDIEGLTTAGIIWVAAAIGMSIGFGEILLGGVFLVLTLLAVFITPFINQIFVTKNHSKILRMKLGKKMSHHRSDIINRIIAYTSECKEKGMSMDGEYVTLELDIMINRKHIRALQDYLIEESGVLYFEM